MPGNPKTSKWYAVKRSERRKSSVEICLSDDGHKRLSKMSHRTQLSRSRMFEAVLKHLEGLSEDQFQAIFSRGLDDESAKVA